MPFLLEDNRNTELFEHFADSEQNTEEYERLNAFEGVDISADIDFSAAEGYELRMVIQPNSMFELEIFMLNHKTKRVAYFNRVERLSLDLDGISNERPISQVLIWRAARGNDARATQGLVQAVFFRKLVCDYNIVVSDSEQTRDGARMWESLLYDAMVDDDLIAAAADMATKEIALIIEESDLDKQKTWLWGQEEVHRERLGLIALKP
ncbi:MAG: hypothetical protein OIF57_10460 [Marinobacterium sp.]|nr:hypothetical protein [Marinobacterium sp.]